MSRKKDGRKIVGCKEGREERRMGKRKERKGRREKRKGRREKLGKGENVESKKKRRTRNKGKYED